jgi:imidazolonepropionase
MDFFAAEDVYDAEGRTILPAWVDSHTHLVFAASREQEFVDRIKGLSYEEIAARGGGILNSARRLNDISEEELYDVSQGRLHEVIGQGTGAIEIKSGYGLSLYSELKMLRVIRRLKENNPIPIKASFLAAHAYPPEYKTDHDGYLQLIINEMLPQIADEGLADYMDVFCERGFFSVDETERLLEAGWKYGLKPKIHANQLHYSGGVQVGVKHKAISVDHLECIGDDEINALRNGNTIPTLLPGAAFFLGIQYQPARKLIDAGLPVCLATDYNPGSCPSGNVPLLLTIACTQLKMTPEEAINAVTLNGAAALELSDELGSIAVGKKANLIVTKKIPSEVYIPYDFGNNPVERMVVNGVFL